jgi:acetyltransferase-like isoleucine patch superfamily enzyme
MLKKVLILLRMIKFKLLNFDKNTPKLLGRVFMDNKNVVFGKNVVLGRNVRFWGDGKIVIGNNTRIDQNTTIFASKAAGVSIGDNTFIAADCYIIDMNHGYAVGKSINECEDTYEKVIIEKNVWIGHNVTVLKGSRVGVGCVVGAKSLVNKKFEDEIIIAGIPAKKIKNK